MSLLLLLTFVSCALGLRMLVAFGEIPPEDQTFGVPVDQVFHETRPELMLFGDSLQLQTSWYICIRLGASALLYFLLSHLLAPFSYSFSYFMSMTIISVGYRIAWLVIEYE